MIDYESEYTVYEQVAADIRRRIDAGEWGPRRRLPTVAALSHEYGVAKDTVAQALGQLRDVGVIYTVRNRGSFVKVGADHITQVVTAADTRIINRPASETEITDLDLPVGGWVTVVERGGEVEVLPADKVEIRGA